MWTGPLPTSVLMSVGTIVSRGGIVAVNILSVGVL